MTNKHAAGKGARAWRIGVLCASILAVTPGLSGTAFAGPGGNQQGGNWGQGGDGGGKGGKGGQSQNARVLTLLQMGDIHGHLLPRPNLRSDGKGRLEGGLANMYTLIQQIRAKNPRNTLLFNTGDTIQGSAEALYTEGQAIVNVLDLFGIDGFAVGNWDYVYGIERFLELFGSGRWGAVAMNVYYSDAVFPEREGQLLLPPYIMKNVNGIKVAILGISSERAINALGPWRTNGITFTADGQELPGYIDIVRNQEKADVVILVSEFGLAKNIDLAERYPGIDVVLSSDMHEETPKAVITKNGTLVSEAGQDGTQLPEVRLTMRGKRIVDKKYIWHTITPATIPANPRIAWQIWKERKPFVSGPFFQSHVNPINGTTLDTPINKVVGFSAQGLYRGNFMHEDLPGVLEGTSHDFLADAFREGAQADIGSIRGFRYGTHIRPGPIKLEDIYHYIPIGPQIAKASITGTQLKNQIENSLDGAFNDDIYQWTGGWLNGYSGVRMDVDPYKTKGSRASNITIQRWGSSTWEPLNPTASYGYAGYWFEQDPGNINGIPVPASSVDVVSGPSGEKIDGTEVVVDYLSRNVANPDTGRVNLLKPLPPHRFGNPEIQPLEGVRPDGT